MRCVCILNEKGGVGKTTLCAYLVWHFVEAGKRVLAIDLDQQGNLTHTLGNYQASVTAAGLFTPDSTIKPVGQLTVVKADEDLMKVELALDNEVPAAFRANVLAAAEHFDLCVIDTPPSLGVRVIAGLITADSTVAPIDLGEYSVIGIQRVIEFHTRVSEHFDIPPPEFLGIIASRYDTRSPRERALFEQLQMEAGNIPLFPAHVTKRDAYARSSTDRVPAWKQTGTAAREATAEIRSVMDEFSRRLGIM